MVAMLAVAAGCGNEIDPGVIRASVVDYGRFELVEGRPALVERTATIACTPDALFGVDYRLDVEGVPFGGVLPIELRWRHPELAVPSEKLWGKESPAGRPNLRLDWGESSRDGRALWRLSHPDERKSGRYEFVIRVRGGDRVLLSQAFDVEGC